MPPTSPHITPAQNPLLADSPHGVCQGETALQFVKLKLHFLVIIALRRSLWHNHVDFRLIKKQHNWSLWQTDSLTSYTRMMTLEYRFLVLVEVDEHDWWNSVKQHVVFLSVQMNCVTVYVFVYLYVNCVHRWTLMTCMENNAHCSILSLKHDTCTAQVMSWLVSTDCLSWESSPSQTAVSVSLACFVTGCESRDAQVCLETEFVVLRLQQGALVVHGFAWMLPKHHCKLCFLLFLFIFGIQYYIIHMN